MSEMTRRPPEPDMRGVSEAMAVLAGELVRLATLARVQGGSHVESPQRTP